MKDQITKIVKNKDLMIGVAIGFILSFFISYYLLQINLQSRNLTQGDLNDFDKIYEEGGTVLYSEYGIKQESFRILDAYVIRNQLSDEMLNNMLKIVFNPNNDVVGLLTESGMMVANDENLEEVNNMVSIDYEYIKQQNKSEEETQELLDSNL